MKLLRGLGIDPWRRFFRESVTVVYGRMAAGPVNEATLSLAHSRGITWQVARWRIQPSRVNMWVCSASRSNPQSQAKVAAIDEVVGGVGHIVFTLCGFVRLDREFMQAGDACWDPIGWLERCERVRGMLQAHLLTGVGGTKMLSTRVGCVFTAFFVNEIGFLGLTKWNRMGDAGKHARVSSFDLRILLTI